MIYPAEECARLWIERTQDEDDPPLGYVQLVETAFGDALCDVPSLSEWRREAALDEAADLDTDRWKDAA